MFIQEVLLPVVGVALTSLVSWGVSLLISWMNSKIKDETLARHATATTQIISDAVMNVFQTYVESLKTAGKFDEAAQQVAKEKAMEIIETQLTDELRQYISKNFGDIKEWLSNKIESTIYSLKK